MSRSSSDKESSMGLADAHQADNDEQRRAYLRALLRDVEALEVIRNGR